MRKTILASAAVALVIGLACSDRTSRIDGPTEPSLEVSGSGGTLTLSPAAATIPAGKTLWISVELPSPRPRRIQWWSSDRAIATVNQNGVVTAVANGAATIFVSAESWRGAAEITVGDPPPPPPPPPPSEVTLIAVGDIAYCSGSGDEATGALVDGIPGTIALLGDLAYNSGTLTQFQNCFEPSWGRHKARSWPSPGNHEYETENAAGYFAYFGAAAGDPTKGYYSYDLGEWHIVVLNSNIDRTVGSAQEQWLRADLAASARTCTLAYWHHPRFNSGSDHGNNRSVTPFWTALYELGADVVLNGHEHVYERFAPQTPTATPDPERGIRQFTVGTGGRSYDAFKAVPEPNSEARGEGTFGVLKLTLKAGGYDWQFVPVPDRTFTDSGSGSCH